MNDVGIQEQVAALTRWSFLEHMLKVVMFTMRVRSLCDLLRFSVRHYNMLKLLNLKEKSETSDIRLMKYEITDMALMYAEQRGKCLFVNTRSDPYCGWWLCWVPVL
eukprot:TRINITY_DN5497_c0_g1_i2.p1 TRINITY_DN5497_c0_g1~~TRINITY_DN5497_c0_g1_i2.p1  ORF type:complete len:106 (-),score=6.09 TRINITY_DN5497_c0_g1_i2:71-388(-)